jgi:molybdopterin-biosynthesis enzyme MoeA-like protein
MRLRMTRIPKGADLILNKVSGAPGFCIGNVIVLAGVPYAPAMHGSSRRPNVRSRRCWSECGRHNQVAKPRPLTAKTGVRVP